MEDSVYSKMMTEFKEVKNMKTKFDYKQGGICGA